MPDKLTQSIFRIVPCESMQDLHMMMGKEYIDYKNGTGYMAEEDVRWIEESYARLKAGYARAKQYKQYN